MSSKQCLILDKTGAKAGFGKVITTDPTRFGSAANLLPRQEFLVGRFTF